MSDLYINITYPVNKPDEYKIESNIREELLSDMLCELIQSQIGTEEDKRKAKKRKIYHIRIDLDLNYDEFEITSDTGNKGLTTGIVMDVIARMK
jgi:hypothetical protein